MKHAPWYEDETVLPELARDVTRRDFMKVGTGLFVFLAVCPAEAMQEPARLPSRPSYPSDFNAYLHIGADGRVTCLVGKVELGQGSKTALAQIAAEELDVSLDAVEMVMGDTAQCPWDMGTFGSLSIRQFGPVLRAAAAEARQVLLQMAAERLRAPVEHLNVSEGVVSDPAGTQSVSYAKLVEGRRIERHVEQAAAKPISAHRVVGQSPRRKDALEKVTGKAKYAGDVLFPGLLHARLLRPPAHGATLKSLDTRAAERIEGVRVVSEGDLVAVLHPHPDVADHALQLVQAEFTTPPPEVDDRSIFDRLLRKLPEAQVVHQAGNLAAGEKLAATLLEKTYLNSYVAHASMETHTATAKLEDGQVTVWASTQTPFPVQQQVAQALQLPPGQVRVITPYVGGGFGGKSASRQAIEAARLAKLTGSPVQVLWRRREEFFYDTFRPAAVVKIRSGVDAAGKLVSWDFQVYGAGDREAKQFYDIPHQRTLSSGGWRGDGGAHPFAVGPWRAPSVNTNTFARESQIDILAQALGRDPVEFRLAHLSDARMRRVLETAAKQFGWTAAPIPSGRGWGVACALYLGTYVATLAEVEVDKRSGHVQVKRVVCAQDQGLTVSPDGSRQQMEGSIMMGLGYALTEEVRFQGGDVLERNFNTYHIPRFSWMPKIETLLMDNPETAATGCGEPPIVTMGAVLANAICDVTGSRVLQLPMTPERILGAGVPATGEKGARRQ